MLKSNMDSTQHQDKENQKCIAGTGSYTKDKTIYHKDFQRSHFAIFSHQLCLMLGTLSVILILTEVFQSILKELHT